MMKLKEEEDEAVVVAMWGREEKGKNSDIGVVLVTGSVVASDNKVFICFLFFSLSAGLDLSAEITIFLWYNRNDFDMTGI